MAKTLNAFQRWRLSRQVKKQFEKEKREFLGVYADAQNKYRAYYQKEESRRVEREQGYGRLQDKTYDPKTYEAFAVRRTAEEHLPYTNYFRSVKENLDTMLAAAEKMALAEVAQAKGYIPWERDAKACVEARAQYDASKAAISGLEQPSRKIGTVYLIDPFIDAMGSLQKHIGEHDIGQRTEIDVQQASTNKTKAEERREKREAAKRNREINKQLRQNAKKSNEREARQQEMAKDMDEKTRRQVGLDEPVRTSAGDKIRARREAEKIDRQISQQLKGLDKTKEERESRQQENLAKLPKEEQEKLQQKFGVSIPSTDDGAPSLDND